jgi:alcohol dehydrogenase class IV
MIFLKLNNKSKILLQFKTSLSERLVRIKRLPQKRLQIFYKIPCRRPAVRDFPFYSRTVWQIRGVCDGIRGTNTLIFYRCLSITCFSVDALFHSVEGFLSKFCNEAAEMVELTAIENTAEYLPRAVKDGHDIEARAKVAFANTMSGYSMEVCSCVSQHAMEHALSGYHQELPHGAGLIMISKQYFTRWIDEHICDERFIKPAKAMGIADAKEPMDFITAPEKMMAKCGVNELKMSDYGIRREEFPQMEKDAKNTMGGLFLCDRFELTDEDAVNIYRKSYR